MTDEEKRLTVEKDSFVKTAIIAFSANCWAINKSMPHDQILRESLRLAEGAWSEFIAFREREKQQ